MSIVPTTFRPRFVGGNLGSGLNPSLLRKLQIALFWLNQEFSSSYTLDYIQGSPSGSSASGGTHLGPGDATDGELVDSRGRAVPLVVKIAFSLMLRLLDCLSYIRGSDVNQDGRKDDTFEPHDHIIDREGDWLKKAPAARTQIGQFIAHQNGLLGGHPDLEATVNNPLTLATYTDRAFADRYQSLSGVSMTLDAHTEPATVQEDDMSYVMSTTTGGFYLVTPAGRVGIGSMGQALDACSALDARATRVYGPSPKGWNVVQGTPCTQAQADYLEALEAAARKQATVEALKVKAV